MIKMRPTIALSILFEEVQLLNLPRATCVPHKREIMWHLSKESQTAPLRKLLLNQAIVVARISFQARNLRKRLDRRYVGACYGG
jgi:hypothetical protein